MRRPGALRRGPRRYGFRLSERGSAVGSCLPGGRACPRTPPPAGRAGSQRGCGGGSGEYGRERGVEAGLAGGGRVKNVEVSGGGGGDWFPDGVSVLKP